MEFKLYSGIYYVAIHQLLLNVILLCNNSVTKLALQIANPEGHNIFKGLSTYKHFLNPCFLSYICIPICLPTFIIIQMYRNTNYGNFLVLSYQCKLLEFVPIHSHQFMIQLSHFQVKDRNTPIEESITLLQQSLNYLFTGDIFCRFKL